jgi:GDP-4-dehydro-6-deoxy-D-mannose reductase
VSLRTILVTGAAGFVGQALMPVLRQTFPQAEIRDAGVDITDAASVTAVIAATRPDAIVHLAAIAAPGDARADPAKAWQVNLHGSLNIGRAIMAEAPDCTMLFVSSADAYGASFRAGTPLDETVPLAPLTTYGATKAAADLALGAMAAEGLRVIRARPFNHTGRGQSDVFVVPAFASQVARIAAGLQDPVMEVGALHPLRDFLDVRDVCAAYAAILARADTLAPGTILNIASGQMQRIGDILQALLDAAGITAEIRTQPARLRATDIAAACGDAALAHRLLAWQPSIPWQRTLDDVLADWTARHRASVTQAGA